MIELMITVALVAVLASIAAPSMRIYVLNNRLSGASQELLRSIQTTRTNALKLQQNVELCLSANPQAAQPTCATSGVIGWIVFQDTNKDWSRTTDATEPVIESHNFDSTKIKLFTDNSGKISFAATGWYPLDAKTTSAKTPATAMVMCDSRGNADLGGGISAARAFVITDLGRARITRAVNDGNASADDVGNQLSETGGTC